MARKPKEQGQANEHDKLIDQFVRCFESAEGKVVLGYLKSKYQDRSSVVGYADSRLFDPYRTLVAEGCRLVYLHIKELIEEGLNARSGKRVNSDDSGSADDIPDDSIWDL